MASGQGGCCCQTTAGPLRITRPGPDGTAVLVGAAALDSPRTLLGYHGRIGHLLTTVPGRHPAAA
ncbi:hypothetical protein ACWDE0_01090 [Streptomyces sp. 900105755]|uniref:hypothetical protein n=1 Tax=Streptomyces sp. Ag109_O5-10 TaxID=1855349 RepID=UPI00089D06FC|nr:hypothetical protein [Streptomyces sp. Ag109_O5-10]SEE28256.1 hypothetical protein SAMN05216533_1860 [Streptomyces sp. Ag109_O5-10]